MTDAPTIATTVTLGSTAPAVEPAPRRTLTKQNPYYWGTGRRKSAVARVRIKPGTGKFVVNGRDVDKFFCVEKDQQAVRTPLTVTEAGSSFDVFVNVRGGGISGQSGAVVLGLARALVQADAGVEGKLKAQDLLTRDSRKVERKKYGRSGARKRYQFSKR